MKCLICKTGDCFPDTTNFNQIVNGKCVVVKNVKATICNNCGEAYFDTETVTYIQEKIKEAIKNTEDVELFNV